MVTAAAPAPRATRTANYPSEFFVTLIMLVATIVVVHALYVSWIRPNGDEIVAQEQARLKADKDYVPQRSLLLTINAPEQEVEIIHFIWALLILGYKAVLVRRERKLLERELIHVPEGIKVLPEDAKDYSRQLEALPPQDKPMLVVRALQRTLDRFSATRSIRDSAETSKSVCDSEADRLDSGLAMVRYIAWAIPAIGFIGTVRHIGDALLQAHKAVSGDITGVTSGLGIAFNATFVALLLTLILMFFLHQLQQVQEQFVHDTDHWIDQHLIRHMQVR
ncbi:MotA/TolQ/ExbB proton channel family protein [Peristeroidobacter soli]|jgi:biopolymer transport protein ExbB/TolQ|uniref:MotA/TolQ/ExbB proton channel family protein n=1 Tax=Peristeroidobacter soli TaxID=2497877 RepID=UPI001C37D992|nr:MotA/TolQ/ExbB proton channel family protein [Peristeroidobacter soli]